VTDRSAPAAADASDAPVDAGVTAGEPSDVALRLDDLTKVYPGAEAPAVAGLDLTIPRGEIVALVDLEG
jgi:hypothetical protein